MSLCEDSCRLLAALGALALASLPAQASVLQVPTDAVQLTATTWNTANGLPQNTAQAIVQTRDGFVWIATFGGVCRLDGEHLEVFDTTSNAGLETNRFTCLFEDAEGTLWLGSDHAGLTSFREGRFRPIHEVGARRIQTIGADARGRLLVATKTDLLRREGDRFVPWHPDRLQAVEALMQRRTGDLLAASSNGVFLCREDSIEQLSNAPTRCIAEYGDQLLAGTTAGVMRIDGGTTRPWLVAPGLDAATLAMHVAADGALWVGTNNHAIRVDRSFRGEAPAPIALLTHMLREPPQAARTFCEDADGGLWIGHTERGVTRLHLAEVQSHGTREGLPPRGIVSVTGTPGGPLFVGTDEGLLWRRGDHFEPVPGSASLGSSRGMCLDPDGALWFGTSRGLCRFDGTEATIQEVWPEEGAQRLRVIVRNPDGTHWFGGRGGVLLHTERGSEEPPVLAPLRDETVRSLALATDGALWIGSVRVLARLSADRLHLRTWECGRDLPFGEVRAILPENGDHAWVGSYGGGLVRVDDGTCRAIDERHGLGNQMLCSVLPFGDRLVLATNSHLSTVARADAEAVAAGRASTLACRDLQTPSDVPAETNGGLQPCATEIGGSFWFCGIESLFEFDPSCVHPLRRTLPTYLRALYVGDRPQPLRRDYTLPAGVRHVHLQLGTCAFEQNENIRFRWRLAPRDAEWRGPGRQREVRLSALPPGDLVFEAQAVDIDGQPSGDPLRIDLHVPVLLWEQQWFWGGAAVLAAAGAVLLVRFGSTRAARRAAHLQALVDSRTGELRSAQGQLEQRVAERTRELRDALQRQQDEQHERQRLERQLQQLQRMESLGQLAGGIAHDFNNLLTVASGAGQLLEDEVSSEEGRELCHNLLEACERGRRLTQHLLAVASRQPVAVARLDLNRTFADLLPVLRSLLGEDVALRFEPAQTPATVQAAVTQVEQILLNLAANARDAMPRGGRLEVHITADERVHVTVRDTGCGMPPEVLERVFEPFYSTKKRGNGRGLGLATVYGITKQLGGSIHIESSVGVGTTVRLDLPLATGPAAEPSAVLPRPAAQHLRGRVLLVEDEADVRMVLARLLRDLGCEVAEAADGEAAIARLQAGPADFDAVVSDVVMPGRHGRQLVEAMRALAPGLPIVFVSGYLDDRLTHRDLHEMGLEILGKPVDTAQLAGTLARAIGAKAAAPRAAAKPGERPAG